MGRVKQETHQVKVEVIILLKLRESQIQKNNTIKF
ncbi:hypothetical protein MED217_12974 [Leeuwenhoekiella blandensis MED217]|uniref:Uncharacterized protein n=1 Tax=Leeuwenhoekiella blandensis (strain CECT 7118 / CCUG 51940 / KCTC 22103 / MED217) TaxID=398720 RepID=A3XPV3_LEEBM|nr:hypothetical protein MED217_12974 [Leeuwenhoekiella blandensis MED217]